MPIRQYARALRALAPAAALLVACFSAAADGPEFTRLAAPKPLMALSIPDFTKLRESFNSSELGKLWEEPSVRSFIEAFSEGSSKRLAELLKEMGTDIKDLKPPTGTLGFAMYGPEEPSKDKKAKFSPVGFFAADAGDNAQAWKDLFEKIVDRGVKDKDLTTEDDTYGGATITILKPIYAEPEKKPDQDEQRRRGEEDGPPEPDQKGLAAFLGGSREHPEAMYLAWNGTTLLISTRLKLLEHGLDAAAGKDVDNLAADTEFKASMAQHPDGLMALFLVDIHQMVQESMREAASAREQLDGRPVEPEPEKILEATGIGSLGAMTMGLRIDSPDGLADVSIGVLAPEKKGILALIADATGPFDPPAFVPPDAAGVTRVSFRFDKLYDFLRTLPAIMPEGERAQMTSMLDQGVNMVKPALDAAGPNVYIIQTIRQPLSTDSSMVAAAIEIRDQGTVANTLSFYAGMLKGMVDPREFEGNTIYTSEMMGMSAGLGFGHLFIGQTPAVENAMRLAGRTDAPKIGAEPGFKDATRSFGTDGCMQSFTDIAQALREAYWSLQNADKEYEKQLEDYGLDAERKDEIMKRFRENQPKWLDKLPPIETILQHVGNSASEVRPTPDGFRGRLLLLKPAQK